MKRIKLLFLALVALAVLGSTVAGSALAASPTILLLGAEAFPLTFESGKLETVKTELQNAAGTLTGEGILIQGSFTNATEGTADVLFLKVKKGAENCTGEAEKNVGEVLVKSTLLLVHDLSATTGVAALLTLSAPVNITCGALTIKITGSVLVLLLPVGSEVTEAETVVHCSGTTVGEPKEVKYWNAANEEKVTLLLANFGTGFKKACEEIPGNTKIKLSKMAELMQ